MPLSHHYLVKDFPKYKERITELKQSDEMFATKLAEYRNLDDEVYDIESEMFISCHDYLEDLKIRRVRLKDQLYAQLTSA